MHNNLNISDAELDTTVHETLNVSSLIVSDFVFFWTFADRPPKPPRLWRGITGRPQIEARQRV